MLAQALAPRVRVNAIAPGITLVSGKQSAENFESARRLTPLGVNCTPRTRWHGRWTCSSPRARRAGTIIAIDGGETLAPHGRDVAFVRAEGA